MYNISIEAVLEAMMGHAFMGHALFQIINIDSARERGNSIYASSRSFRTSISY